MRSKFRLNDKQYITISTKHKLHNEILAAVLIGKDISPIVKDILHKLGHEPCIYYYWYMTKDEVTCPDIIPL